MKTMRQTGLYYRALSKSGLKVETAENASEAISTLLAAKKDNRSFNFILSDMTLPDMTGLELINDVHHRDLAPKLKIDPAPA